MQFTDETTLEFSDRDKVRWTRKMRIGEWLHRHLQPALERARIDRIVEVELARSSGGRLGKDQIVRITTYLSQVKDQEIRRHYFATRNIDETFSGIAVNLVSSVIDEDQSIRHVTDIGAYYSFADSLLAKKYPNVKFTSVDFIPDHESYNAEFKSDNLHFLSGYPLDLLEAGSIGGDVVLFSATAAEIMNPELRKYIEILSARVKYVIFSEPIYPLPDGSIVDPLSLTSTSSIPAYAQPDYLPHERGPVALVHNYRAILEEFGFRILHYHAYRPRITDLRWLEVIAVAGPASKAPSG